MAKSSGFATARDTHDGTDGVYDISVYQDAAVEPSISGGSPNLATRTLATVPSGWAQNPTPGITDPRWRSRTIIDPNLLSGVDKKEKTTLTFNGATGGTNNPAVAEQTFLGLTGDKAGSDATTAGAAEITDVAFTGTSATAITTPVGTGTLVSSAGTTSNILYTEFGGGIYVGLAAGGVVLRSTDGSTWASATTLTGTPISLSYGNSVFVTTNSSGVLKTSSDGITWNTRSFVSGETPKGLSFDGTNFLCLYEVGADNRAAVSSNGVSWVAGVDSAGPAAYSSITASAAGFVIWGKGQSGLYYSTGSGNAIQAIAIGIVYDAIADGNDILILSGGFDNILKLNVTTGNYITYNSPAQISSNSTIQKSGLNYLIINSNKLYVNNSLSEAWSVEITGVPASTYYSAFGDASGDFLIPNILSKVYKVEVSFQPGVITGPGTGASVSMSTMAKIAGTLVTAKASSNTYYYSSNGGSTWTSSTFADNLICTRLISNGNIMVALGNFGKIQTSTNGSTWAIQTPITSPQTIYSVIWTGTRFVATGSNGKVQSSTDGMAWDNEASNGTIFNYSIAYNGSVYVISPYSNANVYTSTDLSSWTSVTIAGGNKRYVASDGIGFVVSSSLGGVYTSTDGANWSSQTGTLGGFSDYSALEYSNGVWFAYSAGKFIYSTDFSQAWIEHSGFTSSLNYLDEQDGDIYLLSTTGAFVLTSGGADSISVTFDSSHSSVPVTYNSTSTATGATQDSDFKTAIDAAITAGTLTGITSAAVSNAVISTNPTVTSDGTRLTSTTTGERTDATVIITGGTGSTAASTVVVTTDGTDSSTGTATSYVITAAGTHSPSSVSGTFANDLTKANALILLRNHFVNDDIGGYTAADIADNKFNVTSDTAGDEADITFVINPIGTGGDLVRTRDVHIPGSDTNTTGGNTLTINIDSTAYSVPFIAGEDASSQSTTVRAFLNNLSVVTTDYDLTATNELLVIEAKAIGDRDDIQRSLDSGKLNQTATTPDRVIIQGNSVALVWSTPVEDGLRGVDGLQGFNTATVSVYQRKSTLPTDAPDTIGTYTFSTGVLLFPSSATSSNNWHTTIDGTTGSNQLYIRSATIASRDATDTIAINEWSGVVQAGTTGGDGLDGLSNQTVIYYQRTSSSTIPTEKPNTQSAYNFGNGTLTPVTNNGWQTFATLSSTGKYLWAVHATASSRTATDSNIATSEWSDAILINEDGDDGTNGSTWYSASGAPSGSLGVQGDFYLRTDNEAVYVKISSTVWSIDITSIKGNTGDQGASITGPTGDSGDNINFVFRESLSVPAKPSPSSGVPSGWTDSPSETPTNDVYTTQGIQTDGTGNYVWGDVIKLTGAKGEQGATWHNGSGVPSASLGNDGDFYLRTSNEDVYVKASGSWSVASNIKGATGNTGAGGDDADVTDFVFQDSASVPTSPADSAGVPSGWLASAPASVTNTLYTVRGIQTEGTGNFNWDTVIKLTGDTGSTGASVTTHTGTATAVQFKDGDGNDVGSAIDLKGSTGDTGTDGAVWHSGTGVPSNSLGVEGDFYLRTDTEAVYKKGISTWSINITTLKGDTGNTGGTGDNGTNADITNWIFQDASSAPSSPSASAGIPSGWSDTAPSSVTNTLYTVLGIQTLGTGNFVWGNVVQLSGDDGSTGAAGASVTTHTGAATAVQFKDGDGNNVGAAIDLKGDTGTNGAAGVQWYSDTGAPSNSLGIEGDFYLRKDNESVYKKGSSVWAVDITSLKGDTGGTGAGGTNADVINWVFQDASSVPTKPSASSGVPSGWLDSAPTSVTNTLYTTQGIQALGTGNFTWGNVIKLSGDDGSNGNPGATGAAGTRSAKGIVYHSVAQASAPTTPSATTYNYTSGAFTGLTSNWSTSASTIVANQSNSYWQSSYLITEATFGGTQTRTFGVAQKVATFTNILASGGIAAGQSLKVGDLVTGGGSSGTSLNLTYSSLEQSAPSTNAGEWAIKASGSYLINFSNNVTTLELSKTDGGGTNRTAFLESVSVGTVITFTSENTTTFAGGSAACTVTSVDTSNSNYVIFNVTTVVTGTFTVLVDDDDAFFAFVTAGSGGNSITSGSGALFEADGDAFIGSSTKSIVFDNSAGTLTVKGDIISDSNLQTDSVTAVKIKNDAVTVDKISSGAVTTDKMTAGTINGDRITAGTITALTLNADAINGKTITGAVLQTGTSGKRIVIEAGDEEMRFYDKDSDKIFTVGHKLDEHLTSGGGGALLHVDQKNIDNQVGSAIFTDIRDNGYDIAESAAAPGSPLEGRLYAVRNNIGFGSNRIVRYIDGSFVDVGSFTPGGGLVDLASGFYLKGTGASHQLGIGIRNVNQGLWYLAESDGGVGNNTSIGITSEVHTANTIPLLTVATTNASSSSPAAASSHDNGGNAFYALSGGYGPFTGTHDGLVPSGFSGEVGDILVDTSTLYKKDVSEVVTQVELSSSTNQKSAIGVLSGGLIDIEYNSVNGIAVPSVSALSKSEIESLNNSGSKSVHINAVGEGQVNVVKEGGNIEIGDLIVTSSTAGKGMKQSDDIVRNYTVAKARESVTWSSIDTGVKMIACIYLAG